MKYHVTPRWDGGDLETAAARLGEGDAIEMFMSKWQCDDSSFAADQVTKVYLYATAEEARAHQEVYGGEILAIDDEYLDVFEDLAEGSPVLAVRSRISKSDISRL